MVNTIVKKITVGVPIRGVTSGAFAITNLGGVDVTNVGQGDMLVYDASQAKFFADSDTYLKTTDSAEVKAMFSAGGDLTYNSTTGQFSIDVEAVYTKANFDSDLDAATAAGSITFNDGTASLPSIANTGDSNTGFHFPAADTIGFTVGGASQFTVSDGVISPVTDNDVDLGTSSLEFKDLYLDGTAHIDTLDVDANATIAGTLDVTGVLSATSLDISGNVDIDGVLETDGLSINGTTVTSTATELNLLDGVSGLVQADFTKLAAIDATATELNIMDGDTSASATTVVDADRVIFNDNGTMKQVAVTDLAAYFDDEITAMPNLVTTAATTVGNLNDGNITSGFGSIDIGSSTIASGPITAAGVITATGFTIGNAVIGEAELEILDGLSTTTAELAVIDGGTSASSVTVIDADRVVMNDDGTMKQVAVTDLAAYFDDEITAMPNLVTTAATTVGTLNSGAISSGFGNIDIGSSTIASGAITTAGVITSNSGVVVDEMTLDGDTLTATDDFIIDAAGDITLDADGGDIVFKDGGTLTGTIGGFSSGNFQIKSEVSNKDLVFQGNDGGSAITALTLDMSDAGSAAFNNKVTIGDGKLVLNSTAVTATAAEINLIDGGATVGTTAIADGDGIIINDAGTMRVSTVQTLAAYLDDEITAMPNLVQTGALNSGSITSGFGTIDTGSSNITTTGIVAAGRLQADNIRIDGNDITSTAGTDLNITPLAGQQIVLDGAIVVDAGVVTGATSITSTAFVGGLTGNVTGNVSGTAATVTGAAQSNITSLGTLTTLTVDNIIVNGTTIGHTSDTDAISIASDGDVTFSQDVVVSGSLTVTGTTTQVDTVTMNAANAVVFEGATADNNETTLTIIDPDADRTQRLINQSGYIPLLAAVTTTAITSTPEELNILDGVTSTATELNVLDGDTSATSTTVTGPDRLILNDGGTMKQISATDLQTFINSGTASPNLVATGALNSGSITSGFGSINVGSSTINTTGQITGGSVVVDEMTLNADTITATDDFIIDAAGDITLDADGGDWRFKDAGTSILEISNVSNNATFYSAVSNADMLFKGNDSGSAITALTLDMSAAGAATFNSSITSGAGLVIANAGTIGSASDVDAMSIDSSGAVTFTQAPVFPDGSLAIADLDIDGGTDIGADLADADLFIVDDGAGGTNRKVTASRLPTYIKAHLTSNSSIESGMINDNVISGQTALTSGLATTDELLVSDGGTIKRMDVSVLTSVTDDNATALAIALG